MKTIIISISVVLLLITGTFMFTHGDETKSIFPKKEIVNLNDVAIVEGKQIIEISAKGGYSPHESNAKAGIPTILRFKTEGTFDCSSSVRISSLNISKSLPQTGTTDIDIGTQKVGTLDGTCGMGMYSFDIKFD